MSLFAPKRKKLLVGTAIVAAASFAAIPFVHADTSSGSLGGDASSILAQIAQYTNGTMTAVTSTSNPIVAAILTALTSLTAPDNATNPATPTPAMQNNFTTYATDSAASFTAQSTSHAQLVNAVFGNFTTATVPYANDMAFPSLLGTPTPIFNPDPRANPSSIDSGMNYLGFAAGLSIPHQVPSSTWTGLPNYQLAYIRYFNTVTAIESYNAFVLSQLYEDAKQGVSTIQKTLVNQATDPTNWFATITNESIGAVLRQSLMYQSQIYVLMTQQLQSEKMILAGIAMNNTMLMLSNMQTESMLVNKAIKT
jgi:hypothetical protein